jgi:hypothetical protein
MSAATALQAVARARIATLPGLTGVYDGPPVQEAVPFALVEAGAESDWGHKSGQGSEVRLAVTVRDAGEKPTRLHGLLDTARAALEAALEVPGWQLVALRWERTRSAREGRGAGPDAAWIGSVEFRARLLKVA